MDAPFFILIFMPCHGGHGRVTFCPKKGFRH